MNKNFRDIRTPFYYYDTALLQATLDAVRCEISQYPDYHVHYALKANANPRLLQIIQQAGFGADCVSGGEVQAAIDAGFPADKVVYAGVGKSDYEILTALKHDIFCFNVESVPELQVINELSAREGKVATVCLRINPDVEAHTHTHIITGMAENKFGIALNDLLEVVTMANQLSNVSFVGLHFHIGSQITNMHDYVTLCQRINEIQFQLNKQGIYPSVINVGGGLGVDYHSPEQHPIANFKAYFQVFEQHLHLRPEQSLHFELGRSIVAQCGSLITKVLYVKQTADSTMNVVFAGQLSVEFSGAKTTTIANEMTSSGSVVINEGVLNFDTNGSWRQAESVAAKGDAKIVLSASHNLGRKTNVELASESSLEIATGAAVRVAELTVGGVKCANGRYRFGDGELLVGPQGFKMIVR